MTDRQRALVATIIYTIRNKRVFAGHRVGVRRISDGVKMYEFNGDINSKFINLRDDRHNRVTHQEFYKNPWGVKIEFIGKSTDRIKILIPKNSVSFHGEDGDYFRFEGRCYLNDDKIEIRDYSQDKDKYLYRVIW